MNECQHKRVEVLVTGRMMFVGECDDDIHEILFCLDCGEELKENPNQAVEQVAQGDLVDIPF